jgi:uncharacterized protein
MRNSPDIAQKIQDITGKIVKEFQPEKIILFGSYAWGEPHEWSDVDLFIVKESNKSKIDRARDIRMYLFGNNFPPIDLLVYTPQEVEKRISIGDFFVKDIFTRGKILYAR